MQVLMTCDKLIPISVKIMQNSGRYYAFLKYYFQGEYFSIQLSSFNLLTVTPVKELFSSIQQLVI